ncbi:50S ribosome-binding GTPase family protein [Leishmania donovani]|uniref:50S ribosome-binding GTPase family protein n=2 Tax=Leishmania donovani TaxID=5661 RepID=A0A504X3D6_LEIDO|nr:50S ribosome-binding GTPase family protein [Leishmania donovani]
MWRRAPVLRKRKVPPLGYSKNDFFRKVRSPGASKPWRDRAAATGGSIEVTSNVDVVDEDGSTIMGSLTTSGPLGMRSPHMPPSAAKAALADAQQQPSWGGGPAAAARANHCFGAPLLRSLDGPTTTGGVHDDASTALAGAAASVALLAAPYGEDAGVPRAALPSSSPSSAGVSRLQAGTPIATVPFGKSLQLNVEEVDTYPSSEPVPLQLQGLKRRSRKAVADSILLPRHINRLFHKIMGWSEELVDLEAEKDSLSQEQTGASEPRGARPSALRKKAENLTDKMKYGVLLDAYEKDRFAIEHQLEIAGEKMERKMLGWEGMHVLDQDAAAEMAHVLENKTSIVMEAPSSFHVPVPGRDCCPGCGALLQNLSEDAFGYVRPGEIEKYVAQRNEKAQLRHEYAARMAELQAHWAKHGRHVGEEWLDFMTQEEFDAFYRDTPRPFTCHRCHALENLGVEGRRKVWSAPDFTDQLRALKEKKCVVVLVVDITDFPGSMVYDLPGLISMNNSVIIAVNKMDCIRNRSFNYASKDRSVAACLVSESYVRRWVMDIAVQFGLPQHQIKKVVPLSAKRGWGITHLISAIEDAANLNLRRPHKPLPTYFVGVANVGKSSVINAMAHALYVPQPPHPESRKVYYTKTDAQGKNAVFWRWYTPPNVNQAEMLDIRGRHDKKASKLMTVSSLPGTTVAVNAVRLSLGPTAHTAKQERQRLSEGATAPGKADDVAGTQTYIYDTPGLLPHWHQRSLLTLLQMRRTLIRKFRNPQCFLLLPGHTLFLGGLAAVDVVRGPPRGLLFLVYTSQKVRNAIVNTVQSDAFWREQLGKALDPPGSYEQLLPLDDLSTAAGPPRLSETRSYLFECYGRHRRRPKADLYVCGLGWTSFCVSEPADVVLRVRTLPGVVHGVREPLRFKDLRARRAWPRLKRRFTAKGIEDMESDVDRDSINTVVRLISAPVAPAPAASADEPPEASVRTVERVAHPRHHSASSAPFAALKEDLHAVGKL